VLFSVYVIDARPFNEPHLNFMEIMNEIFVSIGCYFMFFFTDFVESDNVRFDIGWAIALFICPVIAINFAIMMVKAVIEMKRTILMKYWKWKIKRYEVKQALRRQEAERSVVVDRPTPISHTEQMIDARLLLA
jgi:hypothetical protein